MTWIALRFDGVMVSPETNGRIIMAGGRPRRGPGQPAIGPGLMYTDGLVKRRGTPIEANLTRLCESMTPGPPDAVRAAVMAALIGREAVRDDVALLALQRLPGQ